MRRIFSGLAMVLAAILISGCAGGEVNTQEAAESQKKINESKDKDWQD